MTTLARAPVLSMDQARALLKANGRHVERLERVCDDGAILFIDNLGRPRTAWVTEGADDALVIEYEMGWSAEFGSLGEPTTPVVLPRPRGRGAAG